MQIVKGIDKIRSQEKQVYDCDEFGVSLALVMATSCLVCISVFSGKLYFALMQLFV